VLLEFLTLVDLCLLSALKVMDSVSFKDNLIAILTDVEFRELFIKVLLMITTGMIVDILFVP